MLGILLPILAAIFFGSSTALQKYCLNDLKKFSLRELVKRRMWLASLLLGFIGILLYVSAMKYGSISLVQPLLSISILIPVFVGWFWFGEKAGTGWVHIILILTGVVLLSL